MTPSHPLSDIENLRLDTVTVDTCCAISLSIIAASDQQKKTQLLPLPLPLQPPLSHVSRGVQIPALFEEQNRRSTQVAPKSSRGISDRRVACGDDCARRPTSRREVKPRNTRLLRKDARQDWLSAWSSIGGIIFLAFDVVLSCLCFCCAFASHSIHHNSQPSRCPRCSSP